MSRTETQAHTRQRLLDSAERAFAAEGFAGASLDRIAGDAGFTRGAVYSNFADKADLFVAVLERRLERRSREIATAMREAEDPQAFVVAIRRPPVHVTQAGGQRQWHMLHNEFHLFALRHPDAAELLARYDRRHRDLYMKAIEYLLGQMGVEPPGNPRLVAAILVALDEGLTRQHLVDPDDVPASAMADAVHLLLEAAAALSSRHP